MRKELRAMEVGDIKEFECKYNSLKSTTCWLKGEGYKFKITTIGGVHQVERVE